MRQTPADQGHDHLPDAVVPLVGAGVDQGPVGVGVGLLRVVGVGLGLLEVGEAEGWRVVVEGPGQRVAVVEVEPPARTEQGCHLVGPPADTGQPAQGAEAHIDDVEGGRSEHPAAS